MPRLDRWGAEGPIARLPRHAERSDNRPRTAAKSASTTEHLHDDKDQGRRRPSRSDDQWQKLTHGDVAIAAITSCTNTSNPSGDGRGRPARQESGGKRADVPPYVKTSSAPGSRVVTDYLNKAGLSPYLDKLGFPDRRLWLYHVHRQQRPAARAHLQRRRAARPGRAAGAVGQSQF